VSLAYLRERLRGGARPVARGQVRVDVSRALAKLRDHRLAEPAHWVLEVLRAATASGAERVDVSSAGGGLTVAFDGAPFPAEGLAALFDHALGGGAGGDATRLRLLGLGVNGVLALRPARVEIRSGVSLLHVEPPDRLSVGATTVAPAAGATTVVTVTARARWAGLRRGAIGAREAAAVHARAPFYPAALFVDGERVDRPPAPAGPLLARVERGGGARRLVAAVPLEPLAAPLFALDVLGALVVTRGLDGVGLPLWAWARDDGLQRDASGGDIAAGDPLIAGLCAEVAALADELVEALAAPPAEHAEAARETLRQLAFRVLHTFRPAAPASARVRAVLHDAPLLDGPAGERLSIATLAAEPAAGRPLRFASRPYPAGAYEPPVVLVEPGSPVEWILPPGPRIDVEGEVRARRRREENRRRFEAQPVEEARIRHYQPRIAGGRIDADGVTGEVAIVEDGAGATVRLLRGGRFLEQRSFTELDPLRLVAVADAPALEPDDGFTAARADAAFDAVTIALVRAVIDATVAALAAAPADGPGGGALRRHARDLVALLARSAMLLPPALAAARIWELAGGGRASIDDLRANGCDRHVWLPWPTGALDEHPVVVAQESHRDALVRYIGRTLTDWMPALVRETGIRARMASREAPVVRAAPGVGATVGVAGEGLAGELGLRDGGPAEVRLRLLRGGVLLEERVLPALYGPALAAVECGALAPRADWTGVIEDAAFEAVIQAVRRAERALVGVLVTLDLRPQRLEVLAARAYLRTFVLEERLLAAIGLDGGGGPGGDPLVVAAAGAPLFDGVNGLLSLDEVLAQARAGGRIGRLDPSAFLFGGAPPGLVVVRGEAKEVGQLGELAQVPVVDAVAEVPRARARAAFLALPERAVGLPDGAAPRVPLVAPPFRGEVAWAGTEPPAAAVPPLALVDVRFGRRVLSSVHVRVRLPLLVDVEVDAPDFDPADRALSPDQQTTLRDAVRDAEEVLVRDAMRDPARWRGVLLDALAAWPSDGDVPPGGLGLLPCRFVPATAGDAIAPARLESAATVAYATRALEGELSGREFVVAAADPAVRRALGRWTEKLDDVTAALAGVVAQRRAREAAPPLEEIAVEGDALARRAFTAGKGETRVEGEVVLRADAQPARVWLLQGRRPVAVHEAPQLPPGTAAAADCDGLRLSDDGLDVEPSPERDRVFGVVADQLERLAAAVAGAWPDLSPEERARRLEPLARLTAWVAGRKRRRAQRAFDLPLFRSGDGGALSMAQLLARAQQGPLPVTHAGGSLARPDDWIWWPRPAEQALLGDAVHVDDLTADVVRLAGLRAQPPVESLRVPLAGAWRAPIAGRAGDVAIEGEVVLLPLAGTRLVVELYRERRLLEEATLRLSFPARARVNCDALRPDARHRKAERNAAYAAVRQAVTAALEVVLARLFRDAPAAEWRPHLRTAARWRLGRDGPLAEALADLAPFRTVAGVPVPLRQLMAHVSAAGRVEAVDEALAADVDATGRLVLRLSPEDRPLLAALNVAIEDLSAETRLAAARRAEREARRLSAPRWEGAALVRVVVDHDGWRGELALPLVPDGAAGIVLARGGIAIETLAEPSGAAGVLDHAALPVDAEWRRALLGAAERAAIEAAAAYLFVALASRIASAPPLDGAALVSARIHALNHLAASGAAAAEHLDRLQGTAAALAAAPLFETADGRRVDLRAVAAKALRDGHVNVVPEWLDASEVYGEPVLLARGDARAWTEALARVLGAGRIALHASARSWRAERDEADPPPDTPLGVGLLRLRRIAELLHAGACGRLGPEELTAVLLRRGAGKSPVRYHAQRRVAFVDPAHPLVARALEESAARPERLIVLAAAIYGAINRALERVTDEDEVRLCGALLAHLDANPDLLAPQAPERP